MDVTPAIYLPSAKGKGDPYFHASMSCGATDDSRITARYRVNTLEFVINAGKAPCPKCWTLLGFDALHDPLAARG